MFNFVLPTLFTFRFLLNYLYLGLSSNQYSLHSPDFRGPLFFLQD